MLARSTAGVQYRVSGSLLTPLGGTAWDAACDIGLLKPSVKPNILTLKLSNLPAGQYEFKVSVNGSWDTSYGQDGQSHPGAPNIALGVPETSDVLVFFDAVTHRTDIEMINANGTVSNKTSPSRNVCASMQSSNETARRIRAAADRARDTPQRNSTTHQLRTQLYNEMIPLARARSQLRLARYQQAAEQQADRIWAEARALADHQVFNKPLPPKMQASSASLVDVSLESVTEQPGAVKATPAPQQQQQAPPNNPSGCGYLVEVVKSVFRPVCGSGFCGSSPVPPPPQPQHILQSNH
eukprot:m.99949 g.99949  ORF g.99949 m.99949 type:complete len:296 (-) comp18639_c0_seq2:41-928(-)